MNKIITSIIFMLPLILSQPVSAQLDSIIDQNSWRTFIVHLPINYNVNNEYPLVVNLHGLNSNAAQQQNYSQFNNVADAQGFIVVYPNAKAGSWVINGDIDVDFISHLIDTIRNNFSCNSCLFITGMSQGGFLTYKLACSLPQPIKAVAVVAGNMSQNLQNSCTIFGGLPIVHFHGTADPLVNYNGTFGIPAVPSTINWLVNQNNCNTNPSYSLLPNVSLSDSSTVEKYYYSEGTNGSEVSFYKILNGGHTWPGGVPVPPFGFTNMDINASQIIGSFFSQFCSNTTNFKEYTQEIFNAYPNPFFSNISLENASGAETYYLSNALGQLIWTGKLIEQHDFSDLNKGLYFLKVASKSGQQTLKLIKQ